MAFYNPCVFDTGEWLGTPEQGFDAGVMKIPLFSADSSGGRDRRYLVAFFTELPYNPISGGISTSDHLLVPPISARNSSMNGQRRSDLRPGLEVFIVQKQDQRTGALTHGVVKDILTKSPTHPHGIKVRLENGLVGRVKSIVRDTPEGPS